MVFWFMLSFGLVWNWKICMPTNFCEGMLVLSHAMWAAGTDGHQKTWPDAEQTSL